MEPIRAIDISSNPDLLRLAEEVEKLGKPFLLKEHSRNIALLSPLKSSSKRKKKKEYTEADYEAFTSAAGGWKDLVDTEKLKRDIYESRSLSTRPPLEL